MQHCLSLVKTARESQQCTPLFPRPVDDGRVKSNSFASNSRIWVFFPPLHHLYPSFFHKHRVRMQGGQPTLVSTMQMDEGAANHANRRLVTGPLLSHCYPLPPPSLPAAGGWGGGAHGGRGTPPDLGRRPQGLWALAAPPQRCVTAHSVPCVSACV